MGRGSARGRHLGVESVNAFEIGLDSSLTRVNSHLIREVRIGQESSFQAGMAIGPVHLKSARLVGSERMIDIAVDQYN